MWSWRNGIARAPRRSFCAGIRRWALFVIPGSSNAAHIRENFNIFDFTLTDAEMAAIAQLNKNVKYYNPTPEQEEAYASMHPDIAGQK